MAASSLPQIVGVNAKISIAAYWACSCCSALPMKKSMLFRISDAATFFFTFCLFSPLHNGPEFLLRVENALTYAIFK